MKEFWFYDTTACIWLPDVTPECERDFQALIAEMQRLGFAVYPCERTAKHYKCLLPYHKRAHHGRLKARIQLSGRHIEVLFYQEEVRENPNGGEYDFDKLAKMPYLIRLRYLWTRDRLAKFLVGLGYAWRDDRESKDPLAIFNKSWGKDRFVRDDSGWPAESELKSWSRKDADGQVVSNGDTKYCCVNGRWMRCQVYDGINGMWSAYSNGEWLWRGNASELRSVFPGRGRIFNVRHVESRQSKELERAVRDQDFLRAHAIKMAMQEAKGKELVPA